MFSKINQFFGAVAANVIIVAATPVVGAERVSLPKSAVEPIGELVFDCMYPSDKLDLIIETALLNDDLIRRSHMFAGRRGVEKFTIVKAYYFGGILGTPYEAHFNVGWNGDEADSLEFKFDLLESQFPPVLSCPNTSGHWSTKSGAQLK